MAQDFAMEPNWDKSKLRSPQRACSGGLPRIHTSGIDSEPASPREQQNGAQFVQDQPHYYRHGMFKDQENRDHVELQGQDASQHQNHLPRGVQRAPGPDRAQLKHTDEAGERTISRDHGVISLNAQVLEGPMHNTEMFNSSMNGSVQPMHLLGPNSYPMNPQLVSSMLNVNMQMTMPLSSISPIHGVSQIQHGGYSSVAGPAAQLLAVEPRKKRSSREVHSSPNLSPSDSKATGDFELSSKRLRAENIDISSETILVLIRNGGPQADRARQMFAMTWLMQHCRLQADTNVPRNRIYSGYVSSCGDENIKPLNHAIFGKLVRLVFPEIRTRRLGMRGQSKYHYCGITLVDSSGRSDSPLQHESSAADANLCQQYMPMGQSICASTSSPRVYKQYSVPGAEIKLLGGVPHSELTLPRLDDFVDKADCDGETTATLSSLYRAECLSQIDALRQGNFDKLLSHQASFANGLSTSVRRLIEQRAVAAWVKACDLETFRHMARLLSILVLRRLSPGMTEGLRRLVVELPEIIKGLDFMPLHYIKAKDEAAGTFLGIVDRLLCVNDSAVSVAKLLAEEAERKHMIEDWKRLPLASVAREMSDHPKLLTTVLCEDIPALLTQPAAAQNEPFVALNQWAAFLECLPSRFRTVRGRVFMNAVSATATCALRSLSKYGLKTFEQWWILRSWIDEWYLWNFTLEVFLKGSRLKGVQKELSAAAAATAAATARVKEPAELNLRTSMEF